MLKSSNCLLNYRWTLKISDFGLSAFRVQQFESEHEKYTGTLTFRLLSVIAVEATSQLNLFKHIYIYIAPYVASKSAHNGKNYSRSLWTMPKVCC